MNASRISDLLRLTLIVCALALPAAAQKPVAPIVLTGFPAAAEWRHQPVSASYKDGELTIVAGPKTNWFVSPIEGGTADNAPSLLFAAPQGDFIFSARIRHDFASKWDAGALVVYANEHSWAKFCFEKNAGGRPMVVSVVNRGRSDDVNHYFVDAHEIWFKIARFGQSFFFYASPDGKQWTIMRDFTLNEGFDYQPSELRFGFLAQSPDGEGKTVVFDHIAYKSGGAVNPWTGE